VSMSGIGNDGFGSREECVDQWNWEWPDRGGHPFPFIQRRKLAKEANSRTAETSTLPRTHSQTHCSDRRLTFGVQNRLNHFSQTRDSTWSPRFSTVLFAVPHNRSETV
jgi:hypothetical protein